MTRQISIDEKFPDELNTSEYRIIVKSIAKSFAYYLHNITDIFKNADISMDFEHPLYEREPKIIFTVYVENIKKEDIEDAWKKLRNILDGLFYTMEKMNPEDRKKLKKMYDMCFVHLEWSVSFIGSREYA